ncbi:MAG: hypothetical protein OXU98_07595 [Gammaproteobacteria bacterium]|nr:hypothetical protein [Gammaproteobacteria bacterium]
MAHRGAAAAPRQPAPRRANPPLAAVIDSNPHNRILTFGTEGATDRDIYRQLVG